MNKNAFLGLLIVILLPVAGYFIISLASKDVVPMPRHYIYDSVIERTEKGRQVSDTQWHRVPDFTLTNQLGKQVGYKDFEGKVVVFDFFFTHCPNICPRMTDNMKRLQDGISSGKKVGDQQPDFVQFISLSVDPERDSVEALKAWADRFGIDPENWWLLTGDKKVIYELSLKHLAQGIQDGNGVDTSFFHSDRLVLVDKHRNIRGFYRGLDTAEVGQLSRDIILLSLEKEPGKSRLFDGRRLQILFVFIAAIAGVILLFYLLKKDKAKPWNQ